MYGREEERIRRLHREKSLKEGNHQEDLEVDEIIINLNLGEIG
jgi:hypothetical protein